MSFDITPFPLPLPSSLPPGFEYNTSDISQKSCTSAFEDALYERPDVCGKSSVCVVCGESGARPAHIIAKTDSQTWNNLRRLHYIPQSAKSVEHEPRNGILLCPGCRVEFNLYRYYIRWIADIQRFVFINFSRAPALEFFHGRALFLKHTDSHSPFPALFLLHEAKAHAHYPLLTDRPLKLPIPWQIRRTPFFDDNGNIIDLSALPSNMPVGGAWGSTAEPATDESTGTINLAWNPEQITEILTSSRKLPTWIACVIEGTSWDGTAEENSEKYKKIMDIV